MQVGDAHTHHIHFNLARAVSSPMCDAPPHGPACKIFKPLSAHLEWYTVLTMAVCNHQAIPHLITYHGNASLNGKQRQQMHDARIPDSWLSLQTHTMIFTKLVPHFCTGKETVW